MPINKQSINFLPKKTQEEVIEEFRLSKSSIYASVLPLLATVIWVIAVLIHFNYKTQLSDVNAKIDAVNKEISTYDKLRGIQTELVLKVDSLKDTLNKDFYPQKFFDDVTKTIKSTGDASADIYGYAREDDGQFVVKGKASSYLDLAKIMTVFKQKEEFANVKIKSIFFDKENNNINFEINFYYQNITK